MWKEAVAETGIIFYLMLGVGIVGILAKVMNYVTLRKLVNAAGSMSKSTHKLMKLVRAKYEHACMVHDRVENVNAFVEKYIYEYRGFFLKIHTWRQIQIQNYMVDYLENVCAHRYKRMRKNEKNLEVIRTEAGESQKLSGAQKASQRAAAVVKKQDEELAINIEEEPKKFKKELEKTMEKEDLEEPALKEEAIRQILEEFLA